jgi:hypothetical protein
MCSLVADKQSRVLAFFNDFLGDTGTAAADVADAALSMVVMDFLRLGFANTVSLLCMIMVI